MRIDSHQAFRAYFDYGRRTEMDGGFTLIELVVVMAIIGILAAVAVPTLGSIAQSRGRMAARELLRDVSFARQRAVATGTTCWVFFDSTAETWTIKAEDPNSPGKSGATTLTDPATGQPFVVTLGTGDYAGITITSASFNARQQLGFDRLGKPLGSTETALISAGTVTLSNGAQLTVAVTTGALSVTTP